MAYRINITGRTIFFFVSDGTILLLGSLGNCFVIYMFTLTKKSKQAGSGFVVALAVTDLISSIAIPTVPVIEVVLRIKYMTPYWVLGEWGCYILNDIGPVFVTASSWILVAISVERWR